MSKNREKTPNGFEQSGVNKRPLRLCSEKIIIQDLGVGMQAGRVYTRTMGLGGGRGLTTEKERSEGSEKYLRGH